MKQIFTLIFLLFISFALSAQNLSNRVLSKNKTSIKKSKSVNFNGQWKGEFDEAVPGFSGLSINDVTYVLELTTEGSMVSGYSYTYFTEAGKKYYTICRLTGSLDRETNDIVVTEIERTKFNTPPDFQNCFQTHRLHYEKDEDVEALRGTWIPAPNQGRGCGSGTTVLSRRIINRLPLEIKPPVKNSVVTNSVKKATPKKPIVISPKKTPPVVAKTTPQKKAEPEKKPEAEKNQTVKNETHIPETTIPKPEMKSSDLLTQKYPRYENRRKDIVKTITIEQPTFKLDFYDNGEIDGDSITVFYNGKIVLSHQMLSEKPISLTLALDKNVKENIITMYADNLGTIPPNTALMIVTDGNKRYEVRMESDYGKSGSVIFKKEGQ